MGRLIKGGPFFIPNLYYIFGGVLVVSFLAVSLFMVVSAFGGVLIIAAESFLAVSELLLADFSELQPAAIVPKMAAARAKLKMCFFIGILFCVQCNLFS
jgi:hypothetical protein